MQGGRPGTCFVAEKTSNSLVNCWRVGGHKENGITVDVSFLKEKPCEFQSYFQEVCWAMIDRDHDTVLNFAG